MNWTTPVDIYCERLGPGFWAEPVNALSNLSFILAGLYGLWISRGSGDRYRIVLGWWVVAIGIGSFLFHTVAQRWASITDVVPIWSFVAAFVAFALRRFFGLNWRVIGISAAIAVGVTGGVLGALPDRPGGATNGSEQYLPAFIALAVFVWALFRAGHPAKWLVASATLVFTLSLAFRTMDIAVCPSFPLGTHFLWHTLNGLMLALLLAATRFGPPPGQPRDEASAANSR